MVEHHVDIVGLLVRSQPCPPFLIKILEKGNKNNENNCCFFSISHIQTLSDIMKKPNKIREARLNKKRSRKNNIRKVKVRAKKD